MKKLKAKKVHVYSIFGVLSLIVFLTLSNISWKTDMGTYSSLISNKTDKAIIITPDSSAITFINYLNDVYHDARLKQANLALPVFEKALTGFFNLKNQQSLNKDKDILTVIDFTKPSSEKRMWIIDLKNRKLLLNTYVAHGQGSGLDLATTFSNTEESHQSSLGFYITNETYMGKHGLSLRLDGKDKGINDSARNRDIVIHGAAYVSEDFIKQNGRLGRSFGCPAIPVALTDKIISLIKDETCLFINGNSKVYQSYLLNEKAASLHVNNIPLS